MILIKVETPKGGAAGVASRKMNESDVRIDEIQAEIRESIDRARALVADSERLVRDHVNIEAEPETP